jgi:hypothetical protein
MESNEDGQYKLKTKPSKRVIRKIYDFSTYCIYNIFHSLYIVVLLLDMENSTYAYETTGNLILYGEQSHISCQRKAYLINFLEL